MNQEKDGNNIYFYDTYVLYEIAKGSKNYEVYADKNIITSLMNVYELYYQLLKDKKEDLAEQFFARLLSACVEIIPQYVKEAAKFRKQEIKRKLSYIDCLGYIIAKELKVKFLTGDKEFETLHNVKF